MYAMSDLHPNMTGSEGYRKRALGVDVDHAQCRSSSTHQAFVTETCRGFTGRRCPFWLKAVMPHSPILWMLRIDCGEARHIDL